MKRFIPLLFLCITALADAQQLRLSLPQPEWIVPPVTRPLLQREAGVQPREQAFANRLVPLLAAENYQEAAELIEGNTDTGSDTPFENFSPGLRFVAGQIFLAAGQDEKAEAALLAALGELPDFARAHQTLGLLYLRAQRYDEAREHISRAAALGAVNPELFGYLGYLNQQTENFWGAVGAYQQALMLDHDNRQWRQGLLYSLVGSRQFESALALIDALLAEDSADADLWLYRAQVALRTGDNDTALTSLELAIRLGDGELANLQAAARLHLEHGSIPRAIELLERGLAAGLDYDNIDQLLAVLIRREQWDHAERLLAVAREEWDALNDLQRSRVLKREASLARNEDRLAESIDILEQAVALDPAHAEALLQLAGAYADDRQYIESELTYDRASAYASVEEQALLGLAQLALDQFAYPQALELLREVRALNPQRADLEENIRVLESLVTVRQNAADRQ